MGYATFSKLEKLKRQRVQEPAMLRKEFPEQTREIDMTPPTYASDPRFAMASRTVSKRGEKTKFYDKKDREITSESLAWENLKWGDKLKKTIGEVPWTIEKPTMDLTKATGGLAMMVGAKETGAGIINKMDELERDVSPMAQKPSSYKEGDDIFTNPSLLKNPEYYGRSLINQMYNIPIMSVTGGIGVGFLEAGGEMENRYKQAKGRGERVDLKDQAFAATIGVINGYLEKIGFDAIFKSVPGSKKIVTAGIAATAKKLVSDFVKRTGKATAGVGLDMITEFYQEAIPILAAKAVYNEGGTLGEVITSATEQGRTAASEAFAAGGVATAPRVVSGKFEEAYQEPPAPEEEQTAGAETPPPPPPPGGPPASPTEEFRNTLKSIPEEARAALTEAVTNPMTAERVAQLSVEERAVVGIALNTAKQLPNADLVTINKNIGLIEQSGVEIPTKTIAQQVLEEEQTKKLPAGEKPKQLGTQTKPVAVGKPFSVIKAPEASIKKSKASLEQKTPVKETPKKAKLPEPVKIKETKLKAKKPAKPLQEGGKKADKKLKYPKAEKTLSKKELDRLKEGVTFPKQKLSKLFKASPEFKANPVFTMKDGKLRFVGKTTTLNLLPKALGLDAKKIKEGTRIEVSQEEVKQKRGKKATGQIPILSKLQKMTKREAAESKETEGKNVLSVDYVTTFREAVSEFRKYIKESELPVHIADKIVPKAGERAFGVTTKAFVAFVRNPKENTAPHEAVHAYIQLFIGQKKFDKLIKYIKTNKLAKGASTKTAEEWLADNFEYYVAENKMKEADSKLKRLFDWVRKQTLKLAGKENQVEDFYEALYTGKRPGFIERTLSKPIKDKTRFQVLSDKEAEGIGEKIDTAFTTEKGTLRVQKVFDSAIEKLYGKEAVGTIKVKDILKREPDQEIVSKGFQTSFAEGKRIERAKSIEKNIALREKQAKAIKELRTSLKSRFKNKEAISDAMKKDAITYIKASFPPNLRGLFLNKLAKVKTPANLAKIVDAVDAKRKAFERRDLARSIDKVLKNIHRLPVDVQRTIIEITSKIDLKNRTKKLLTRLNATKEYLDRQAQDVDMPRRVMEELGILKKTPFKEVTTDQLIQINNRVKQLNTVGRSIIANKAVIRKMSEKQKMAEISKDTRNLDLKSKEELNRVLLKRSLSKKGKALLKVKGFRKWLRNINLRQIGTDRVFMLLDKGQVNGPNMSLLMNPVDDAVSDATGKTATWRDKTRDVLNPLTEDITENMSIREKAKRLAGAYKKSKVAGENIAIYAFSKETGGSRKLIESGKATEADIAKVTEEVENDVEQKARYTFMRTALDEIFPKLQKSYETLNPGETINFVKNFFPMRTDYNIAQAQPGEGDFSAGINFGSLKNRTREAKQVLRTNAITDFQNYMEQAIYYIEVAEAIKNAGDVINSEAYGEQVGVEAQRFLQTWLKITARKGGHLRTPALLSKILDWGRVNITISMLGLRPSSMIRQLTAWNNGVAAIGLKYQELGSRMYMKKEVRAFIKSSSPQMLNRAGGDILWQELSEKQAMKKLQEMSMSGVRLFDYMVAAPTWIGAYQQKMDELGLRVDLTKVNLEARRHADLMVRLSAGTAQFHKAPQFVFNENRSMWRAFYQFETFNLSNWSQWSQDVPRAWRKEGKVAASKKVAFLSIQIMMSGGITYLNGKLIAELFGQDDDDRTLKKSIMGELVQSVPFLNKLFGLWNYQSTPVVLIKFTTDILSSFVFSFKGKKPSTRMAHQLKLVTGIAQMITGLPPKFIVELLTKAIKK